MTIQDEVTIGGCRLILGDCLDVLPGLGAVDHVVTDPPYEQSLHDAKNSQVGRDLRSGTDRALRTDGGAVLRSLDFEGIDQIRDAFVQACVPVCRGWFIVFCTVEGTARWADVINPSPMKYKRSCIWVKPDSTPQLNGQGPAQGAECFVTAWVGKGVARWNAGGKRGIYTHNTNPRDRHGGHPTEKPWRLMREILHDFTSPGDLILDPFAGSGTTLVAAALTGRRAIGIEKDPNYFEMMRARVTKAVSSAKSLGVQTAPELQGALL